MTTLPIVTPPSSRPKVIVTPKPRGASSNKQRRTFALFGSRKTRFNLENVGNNIMDCCTYTMEKLVLLLGPMLIIFASIIISGLTWTFFKIVLPMLKQYYLGPGSTSKNYDLVVRELAIATNFDYPETPAAVEAFRKDFEDRMLLRIKRRQMRSTTTTTATTTSTTNGKNNEENEEKESSSSNSNNNDALAQRKNVAASSSKKATTKQKLPSPKQVRNWMLMASDEWGYCQRSKQPKPPRSHYDHVTKALVMNLDHYCPWMFNTVGYFNYRYFCSFLWFVVMAMAYGAAVTFVPFQNCSGPLYQKQHQLFLRSGGGGGVNTSTRLQDHPFVPFRHERMPISMSFMLCLAVGIAVAFLGMFHLYLLLTAQTTIEFHGNWMNKRKASKLNKKWKNPYDFGYKRNWEQVFGSSQKWYWALIIPSTRQPEYLPLPMPGEEGRRRKYKQEMTKKSKKKKNVGGHNDNDDDGAEIV